MRLWCGCGDAPGVALRKPNIARHGPMESAPVRARATQPALSTYISMSRLVYTLIMSRVAHLPHPRKVSKMTPMRERSIGFAQGHRLTVGHEILQHQMILRVRLTHLITVERRYCDATSMLTSSMLACAPSACHHAHFHQGRLLSSVAAHPRTPRLIESVVVGRKAR